MVSITRVLVLSILIAALTGCWRDSPPGKQLFIGFWNGHATVLAPVFNYSTVVQKIMDQKLGTYDFITARIIKRTPSGAQVAFHRSSMGMNYEEFDQDLTIFFPYDKVTETLFFELSPVVGIYRKNSDDLPIDPREAAALFSR